MAHACKTGTGIEVVSQGKCPEKDCPDGCPWMIHDVCGSDGKTYHNECFLEQHACETGTDITVASQGRCLKEELQCGIDCWIFGGYQPVCGSDGKTYTNEACLEQHACETGTDITVASQGRCPKKELQCGIDCWIFGGYQPVCGSDGKTYTNE